MKAITVPLVLLGLLSISLGDSLRSQITKMNDTVQMAMKTHKMDAMSKLIKSGTTNDFTYTEGGRTVNCDQMISTMKQGIAMMNKVNEARSSILSLTESKDSATCKTRHWVSGVMVGPDKKSHTMSYVGVSLEKYRKHAGTWKMASMTWTNESMKLDGKKMAG